MGSTAYTLISRMTFRHGEIAIEIGSDRGENSTGFLRAWCGAQGIEFISIDIDPERPANVIMDGATWLRQCDRKIGFAYLDNFDWVYDEIEGESWVLEQVDRYLDLGLHMTNLNSQAVHWEQARELQRLMAVGSLIVLDDTWADREGYHGKGALAVPWLVSNGWRVEKAMGDKWNGFFLLRRGA